MFEQVRDIFFEYAPWVLFIPLALSIAGYKKYSPALKNITWYLALGACTQVLSFILWKLKKNNLPISHIYTVLEYLVLLRFYYFILKGFLPANIFYVLAIAFPLFAFTDSFFIETIYTFNTYSRTIEALVFIFLAMCWFIKIVSTPDTTSSYPDIKLINSAFLLYFSGAVILFSFRNALQQVTLSFRLSIWSIHTLLAVILYLLITIGLCKHQKT